MKKVFLIIVVFYTLSLSCKAGSVYAKEDISKPETIEQKDLPKLIIDPDKEVPIEKLLPPPTPTPVLPKITQGISDFRSWTKSEYKNLIEEAAKKYSLDPQVIYATIMTESEGNKYAFRYEPQIKDASLCMGQILISTARSLGFSGSPKELYKPEVCIDLIGKYHRKMLSTYGELTPIQLATAYNAGSPWKRPVRGHIYRFQKWYNEEKV